MLKIENLQKNYKNFSLNCSMELKSGNIVGLIGPNGSGKSTSFKAVLGLIKTDGGKIEIFGKNICELTLKDREKIGVVLSDSGFSGYLCIKDLIPVLVNMYENFDKTFFYKYIKEFDLPIDKKIKTFSTGMKAKLKLIIALSHRAKFLILDEPTSGLDVLAREKILDMLRAYMEEDEERSILISSHISGDLENFCDEIYMINNGRIILHEDTDVLLSNYGVLKLTKEQYDSIDKTYIFSVKKESYGYKCMTGEKQFYKENYPEIIIEKASLDEFMKMSSEKVIRRSDSIYSDELAER